MSKERRLPVSIMVQSVVAKIDIGQIFTPNEIIMLINGTTRYGAKNIVASVISIRNNLNKMRCLERSEKGVRPLIIKRKEHSKESCLECSRNKHLSEGCMLADPVIEDHYFPEDEKLKAF